MPVILDGTLGISPAQWTTANRPPSPNLGQSGYNTTINGFEIWSGTAWQKITNQSYSVSYLAVAGGGGGGSDSGGGGGAGGLLTGTTSLTPLSVYTITIGAGGAGGTGGANNAASGSDSSFGGIATALAGGRGGGVGAGGATGGSGFKYP
jgi:hypothetical protein